MPQTQGFYRQNYQRLQRLSNRFSSYGDLTYDSIRAWIDLFEQTDGNLAIKILENVYYVNGADVLAAYHSIHQQLVTLQSDLSRIYYAGYGRAGSSGQAMLHKYKLASNLRNTPLEAHFIYMADAQRLRLEQEPMLLFVDDFVGTGDEAVELWNGNQNDPSQTSPPLQSAIPPNVRCYLAVIIAYDAGLRRIHQETAITVLPWKTLTEEHKVLSPTCVMFNDQEKEVIRGYCAATGCAYPSGFGDTQSLVVFEHNCPNNSLPILWYIGPRWRGLFPRR